MLESGSLPTTPIGDNLFRRFLFNQAQLGEMIADAGGGRHTRTDDVALADSGGVVPYFNMGVMLRPVQTADDPALDAAEDFFASCPSALLLSIWPTPDLSARGWNLVGHPGFVARPASPVNHRVPGGVTIDRANTAEQLAECERIAIEGYPLDEAKGAPSGTVLPPKLLDTTISYRLGSYADQPVAAASSFVAHGVANLVFRSDAPRGAAAWCVGEPRVGPRQRSTRLARGRVHERLQPPRFRAHGVHGDHAIHAVVAGGALTSPSRASAAERTTDSNVRNASASPVTSGATTGSSKRRAPAMSPIVV